MQQRKTVRHEPSAPVAKARSPIAHVDPGLAPTSPARSLQERLAEDWRAPDASASPRWSPRAMLLLSGGVSLALWCLIGGAAATLF